MGLLGMPPGPTTGGTAARGRTVAACRDRAGLGAAHCSEVGLSEGRTWAGGMVKENKFKSILDANLSADLVLILLFISEAQLKIHKLRKLTDGACGIFVSYLNL